MTDPAEIGEASPSLPSSQALAEAEAESLTELFGRSPLEWTPGALQRGIEALRAQRARWERLEKEQASRPKAGRGGLKVAPGKPEDLGL